MSKFRLANGFCLVLMVSCSVKKPIVELRLATASSYFQQLTLPVALQPANLVDGNTRSGWCEGNPLHAGRNEWLHFFFAQDIEINRVEIFNGLATLNQPTSKVRSLMITSGDQTIKENTIKLTAKSGFQAFELPKSITGPSVRIKIGESFVNRKDKQGVSCLSEIRFGHKSLFRNVWYQIKGVPKLKTNVKKIAGWRFFDESKKAQTETFLCRNGFAFTRFTKPGNTTTTTQKWFNKGKTIFLEDSKQSLSLAKVVKGARPFLRSNWDCKKNSKPKY